MGLTQVGILEVVLGLVSGVPHLWEAFLSFLVCITH